MKLPGKSENQANIDIADYYAIKIGPIWRGLKQENAAFWWLCIYLFFEYVRPQSIYTIIDVLPWGQIALIMAIVTAIHDRSVRLVSNPGNALFISFFIIVFLSCVFAFDPRQAFDEFYIPVNWLILYFLIITVVNTEKKYFLFMLLFLLVNFKMSQHGFTSYAQRGFGYAKWGLSGSPGWFENAGDFGIQMVIFTPLAIAFILALRESWGRYMKLLFYLMPLTSMITIIGTASRGAQLGLLATGLWFLVKSRKGMKAVVAIIVVGVALYSVLPDKMLEEYSTAGDDATSQDRLVLWKYALEVAGSNPVVGVGLENWMEYCWFSKPTGVEIRSDSRTHCREVHNTYLEAAAEIGFIGFGIFILTLIYMFVLNARTRANAGQQDSRFIWYIAHGLDGGLIGCIVSITFFSILFYPIIWVQLALTVALHELSRKNLPDSKKKYTRASAGNADYP